MRMWMCNPKGMCRKHLLGEHFEIHSHRHNFVKGHSIKGRIFPIVQIEPASMKIRHDLLALEMKARGYKHASPYKQPSLKKYSLKEINAKVDRKASLIELYHRCPECRKLGQNSFKIPATKILK